MKFITAATLIVALASVASATPIDDAGDKSTPRENESVVVKQETVDVEDYRVYYPRLVVRQPVTQPQVIRPQPRPQMTFADALSKFANDIAAATNRYNQSMKQQQLSQAQLQAQAQAKAQAKARAKALAQKKARAEAEAIAVAQAEAEARAQSIAKSKAEQEARDQAQSLAAAESRAKAISEARAKAVAEARAKAQALAESRAKAVSQAQAGNAQAKSDTQATSGAGGNAQATSNSAAQSLENINAVIHGNVNVQNGGQVAPPAAVGSASPSEELAAGVAETQKLQQADSNGQANAQGGGSSGGAANAQSTSNSASQSLSGINAIVHGNVNLVNGVNQGGSGAEGAANGGAGQGAAANAVSNSASQSLSGINAIVHGDVNVVNGGTTGGVVGAASSGAAEGDQGASSAQQPGVEKPVPGDDTLQTDSVTPTVANVIVSGLVNLCVKELGVTVGNVNAQGVAEAVSHASSELHSLLDSILNFCQALQGREQLENPVALGGHLGQIKDNNVAATEASKNNLLNLLGGLVTDGKPDQLAPECVCVTPKIELPEQQQPQVPAEQPQIPNQPEAQEVTDIVFPDTIDPTVHKQKQPVLDA